MDDSISSFYEEAIGRAGFAPRAQQLELVEYLYAASQERSKTLMAQAPTATGKSLAGLIVGCYNALKHQQRTVIATYTLSLQSQYDNDIKTARIMCPSVDIQPLRGAANYACRNSAREALEESLMNADVKRRIKAFIASPAAPRLVISHPVEIRSYIEADTDSCGECEPKDCEFKAARARAASADIVVTNHALVLCDTAAQGAVLGEHSLLVVDEAHSYPKAAASHGGVRVNTKQVLSVMHKSPVSPPFMYNAMVEDLVTAFNATRTRHRDGTFSFSPRKLLESELVKMENALSNAKVIKFMQTVHDEYEAVVTKKSSMTPRARRYLSRQATMVSGISQFARDNRACLTPGTRLEAVPVVEMNKASYSLVSTPIEARTVARAGLACMGGRSVALMSATIGMLVDGKPFVAREAGIEDVCEYKYISSPFNYPRQLRIHEHPATDVKSVRDHILPMVLETGGRTLILANSHRLVDVLYNALNYPLASRGITVIRQTDDNRLNGQWVEEFKADETSVLVGTRSFNEGVDVKGLSLLQVIMWGLPEAMVNSRIQLELIDRYRERHGGTADEAYKRLFRVPASAMLIEQGIGRAIRSVTDAAIVSIVSDELARREPLITEAFTEATRAFPGTHWPQGVATRADTSRWLAAALEDLS